MFVPKKVKKLKLKTHRGAAKRFKITSTGKNHAHAFRQAAPAGHQEGQSHAPLEEIEAGPSRGRQERSQDVAVRLELRIDSVIAVFAVPGRAQPATVGLPASGSASRSKAGPMLARMIRVSRIFCRASKHAVEMLSLSDRVPVPLRGNCLDVSDSAASPHRRKHHGSS